MQRPHDPVGRLLFVRGSGVWLWDQSGKDYIDLTSSYSSLNFGHSHPQLVAAAVRQLQTLPHLTGAATLWRNELCQALANLAPFMDRPQTWLCSTGARAIEAAWKIASASRPGLLVSMDHGFHGRSIATSLLSDTPRSNVLDASAENLANNSAAYPQCSRCPFGEEPSACCTPCFDAFERWMIDHAHEISAVLIEPVAGARGYLYAPDRFFHRLRRVTRELGILLIADEIQTGLGRLGGMLASIDQGWHADLIVIGKSLGGGLVPISAVIGSHELIDRLDPGVESETFAGDPLACGIALEVLRLLDDDLLKRAKKIGGMFVSQLRQFKRDQPSMAESWEIDSRGCSIVLEFSADDLPRGQALAMRLAESACEAGVLVHRTGPHGNRIVLLPPLIITNEEIAQATHRLVKAFPSVVGPK